jgi:hypothetical protein
MYVQILYLLQGEPTPRELVLAPQEYFDPPEAGERLAMRSEPRHWFAWQDLDHPPEELGWTVLEVADSHERWRVRT